jgi:hypothetical protein
MPWMLYFGYHFLVYHLGVLIDLLEIQDDTSRDTRLIKFFYLMGLGPGSGFFLHKGIDLVPVGHPEVIGS